MKNNKSNIHVVSNVYPVKMTGDTIDMMNNEEFISKIIERKALRRLVDMVFRGVGLRDDKDKVEHARKIPGITDWQAKRIGTPDEDTHPYALRHTPGEKQWGIVISGGKTEYVCKCRLINCPMYYTECRPEEANNADF